MLIWSGNAGEAAPIPEPLGAKPGIAVLCRLPPTLGSLSCQVDDALSLVTQISSKAKGKWPSILTCVLQAWAY